MKTRWIMMAGLVGFCGMAQAAFVTIGNVGNAADTTGYGAVGYTYQISATEVTIAEFQASGAGDGDENYWEASVGTAAPASYVSGYEARKYCNWLTTGDIDSGYYGAGGNNMSGLSHDAYAAANGLTYFLPTEDEWYKAAYFKPDASGYSLYANGTDTIPIHGTTDGWNYYSSGYANGGNTWTVGYGGEEQNGTYDMMGNVLEWTEGSVTRGGCYCYDGSYMLPSSRVSYDPSIENNKATAFGFRVVAVPEPATALLLALGGGVAWLVRLKQRL